MTAWREVRLGDLGDVVTGGTPAARNADWFGDETAFITPTDIKSTGRRVTAERSLSAMGRAGLRKKVLPPGSVCFVSIGATIGKLCLTDTEAVTNQQINSIVPNDNVDGRFVYYLLRHEAPRIAQMAGGAATPIINKSTFSKVSVRVPDKDAQARIGLVLGALDDLIENNQRRIEVLETIARVTYREWFVHFRFPGHESVEMVDSTAGGVPAEWPSVALADVAELDRTAIQPAKFPDEVFDHYSIPAFDSERRPSLDVGEAIKSGKYLVSDSAVLVSKLNPRIERTWLVDRISTRRAAASTEFLVLRPKGSLSLEWLYLTARSERFQDRLRALSGGTSTSHQRAKPNDFLAITVVRPEDRVVAQFDHLVSPVLALTSALRDQAGALAQLRARLLPKLVSGQIDVSALDLDALVEGAVA